MRLGYGIMRLGRLALAAAWLVQAPATAVARNVPLTCPENYTVHEGLNTDFPVDGVGRAFIVVPPERMTGPAPVWVPLTGTVESTHDNLYVPRSGMNAALAKAGFMVIAPVRECAAQNPDQSAGSCNGPGIGGWNWRPWHDGRARSADGARWQHDAGPTRRSSRRWCCASGPSGSSTTAASTLAEFRRAAR